VLAIVKAKLEDVPFFQYHYDWNFFLASEYFDQRELTKKVSGT